MNSDNYTYLLLTDNDEESSKCADKSQTTLEYMRLINTQTRDEIRNFVIDELIYRLKDMYPSISDETISIIADEVVAAIDNIVSEASNFKNIDELIKNDKTYNTLAITTLMIIRNREINNVEVSEVDLTQTMKTIIKNTLKLYSQET